MFSCKGNLNKGFLLNINLVWWKIASWETRLHGKLEDLIDYKYHYFSSFLNKGK